MKYSHTPTSLFFFFMQTELYITATFALRPVHLNFFLSSKTKKKEEQRKGARTTINWWSLRPHPRGRWTDSPSHVCQQWRCSITGCRVTFRLVPIHFVKLKHIDWQNSGWSRFSIEILVNMAKLGIAKRYSPISLHTRRPISWLPPHQKLKNWEFRILPSPLIVSHLLFRNTRLKSIMVTESQRPCLDTPAASLTWIVFSHWIYWIIYTFLCTVKKCNVM